MTPEQKAAFINAQAALMQAEMQGMIAENIERQRNDYALAYGPEQWAEFSARWEATLGHNQVIQFFRT